MFPTEFLSIVYNSIPEGNSNDVEIPLNGSNAVIPYLLPTNNLSLDWSEIILCTAESTSLIAVE